MTLYLKYGLEVDFISTATFALIMSLVMVIDWEFLIIPDRILLVGALVATLINAVFRSGEFLYYLSSAVAAGAILYLIRLIGNLALGRQSMGLGDVKLGAVIGLFTGLALFLFSLWLAAAMGAAYGVLRRVRISGRASETGGHTPMHGEKLPLGSFLALASCGCFVFHDSILQLGATWSTFAP